MGSIDMLGVTVVTYLVALLVVGVVLGMRKVRRYTMLIMLQAILLLLSFLVAQNLGAVSISTPLVINGVETAILFITATMLFALANLRKHRGEVVTARFSTALLFAVVGYLLIKLLAVTNVYVSFPDFIQPLLYLILLLSASVMIYLRARQTKFL